MMKPLLREVEERYGAARNLLMPVSVLPGQLDMLRAAEEESGKGWNIMLLLFAGARLVTEVAPGSQKAYRLPEFRMPSDILDLEVFEETFRDKVLEKYGLEIGIGRYLMMVHCTFMTQNRIGETDEDYGTSSRTLHIFTARAHNSDELQASDDAPLNVRLVKPTDLLDNLLAEWADVKSQIASAGTLGDMRAEYDKSWAFVRARVVAMAFQSLFGWPLPEM
jgi:hypothetical protein